MNIEVTKGEVVLGRVIDEQEVFDAYGTIVLPGFYPVVDDKVLGSYIDFPSARDHILKLQS
jgi:hypothetical protein